MGKKFNAIALCLIAAFLMLSVFLAAKIYYGATRLTGKFAVNERAVACERFLPTNSIFFGGSLKMSDKENKIDKDVEGALSSGSDDKDQLSKTQEDINEHDYLELFNALKNRYKKKFCTCVEDASERLKLAINQVLGAEFDDLLNRQKQATEKLSEIKNKLFADVNYGKLKSDLALLKEKLELTKNEDEKKEINAEIITALEKISEIDIGLLRDAAENRNQLIGINNDLKKIIKDKGEDVAEVEKAFKESTRDSVVAIVIAYNSELKALNEAFCKPYDKTEFPFEKAEVDLEMKLINFDGEQFFKGVREKPHGDEAEYDLKPRKDGKKAENDCKNNMKNNDEEPILVPSVNDNTEKN